MRERNRHSEQDKEANKQRYRKEISVVQSYSVARRRN